MTVADYIAFLKTQGVDEVHDMGANCWSYTCENGSLGSFMIVDGKIQEFVDDDLIATHDTFEQLRASYLMGSTQTMLDGRQLEVIGAFSNGDLMMEDDSRVAVSEIAWN